MQSCMLSRWSVLRVLTPWGLRCGRDPNKPLLRLYAVPLDAFDQNYADEPLQAGEHLPAGAATPAAAGDDD